MQTLLTKALATSVAVAGLGLVAVPQAQAAFFGSFGISGDSTLTPGFGAGNPSPITFNVLSSFCDSSTGGFTGACGGAPVTISGFPQNFVYNAVDDNYSLGAFSITFGPGVVGATNPLTVNVDPGTYFRIGSDNPGGQSIIVSNPFLTGSDIDGNTYGGAFTINFSGGASTYSMSFTTDNVPEPLTMLGASAAIAFGAAFKRRNANKG